MRKAFAVILMALAAIQGASVMSAEPATLGAISGRTIDATGRAVAGQRVELLTRGQAVGTTVTDTRGSWSFRNLEAGAYVVRTNINGSTAGSRVTIAAGQEIAGTLIVVPTSAVAPQFGALASIVTNLSAAGFTAAASAVSAVVNVTEVTNLDEETVAEIISALPPTERTQFAQQILAIVEAHPDSGNIFTTVTVSDSGQPEAQNNFLQVIQQVIAHPDAPVITITAS